VPTKNHHDKQPAAEEHGQPKHETRHVRKELEKRVEELSAEVEALGAEVKDAKDKYLRALADFDNYRKRIARENEERTRCANEDLIRRLLDVVDNLERAVGAAVESRDFDGLKKGLELTYASLKETLAKEGLCAINCLGEKFDPNYHEAIMAVAREGSESDSVVDEVQKGYLLHGRVLRPSKVVVSK